MAHGQVSLLSVVIPCRNGAKTIAAQLDALLAQECPLPFEVLVVDNGSTDETSTVVEQFACRDARVRIVPAHGKPGINHARNTGVHASAGTHIVLCDSDDVVQTGFLRAYVTAFANGMQVGGGGVDRITPTGRVLSQERQLYLLYWNIPWPIGANCGFARNVFDSIDGFDEQFFGGSDEVDFFWRAAFAGWDCQFVNGAVVTYAVRPSLRGVFLQFHQYGRSHVRLYKKFRSRGMPSDSYRRTVMRWARATLQVLLGATSSTRLRRGLETLGVCTGRLRESVVQRVQYL